jgi:hypothetical protein
MNRREWLKSIGPGSLALASLPTIVTRRATPAWADDDDDSGPMNFHFSATSYIPKEIDRLLIAGSGRFTSEQVKGQGSFAHYDGSTPGPNNIRFNFTGTWRATRLVSFDLLGTYGTDATGNNTLAAGKLVMEIDLVRPGNPSRVPSLLTLVSNLGPADFMPDTGEPDGVTLLAPNKPGGFLFIPVEFRSTVPRPTEAFVPVVFSTLVETRHVPPAG